ncbi:cytochrome oxidase complex assembly protein 1-domain-containing protein [Papiliotrema laurentii]|uniref:Cytochrome oxidase complex assembly protein 1-domain-containing protein n=1 Tax=Papiliotrema laurentii TaxID=5418 RepID=A0AAD9FWC9_PAPLA|nr:cytochrome oxidase complex assembly protein 1-domain-containing protein [Papiliotrema laurentii]
MFRPNPSILTRSLPRSSNLLPALRLVRYNTSAPPPPPRATITPTTFSEKSSPRNVHDRPEQIRGFPPAKSGPQWQKTSAASASKPGSATGESGVKRTAPAEEAFDGPSKPRLVYSRGPRRDLPDFSNRTKIYVAVGAAVLAAWGLFLLYATNAERLASSVMRSLQFHLRNSLEVRAVLGSRVKLEEPWYVLGDPWISGNVNTMQGRVDLKFRIKGDKQAGTIYFTSIRPSQGDPWRIGVYCPSP